MTPSRVQSHAPNRPKLDHTVHINIQTVSSNRHDLNQTTINHHYIPTNLIYWFQQQRIPKNTYMISYIDSCVVGSRKKADKSWFSTNATTGFSTKLLRNISPFLALDNQQPSAEIFEPHTCVMIVLRRTATIGLSNCGQSRISGWT